MGEEGRREGMDIFIVRGAGGRMKNSDGRWNPPSPFTVVLIYK
jgi:hypothetical protein